MPAQVSDFRLHRVRASTIQHEGEALAFPLGCLVGVTIVEQGPSAESEHPCFAAPVAGEVQVALRLRASARQRVGVPAFSMRRHGRHDVAGGGGEERGLSSRMLPSSSKPRIEWTKALPSSWRHRASSASSPAVSACSGSAEAVESCVDRSR